MSVQTQIELKDLSLEQLVSLNQGFGRQIDAIREQRLIVKQYIDAKLAGAPAPVPPSQQDATAPGVDLTVQAV